MLVVPPEHGLMLTCFFNEQSVVPQGDYHHLRFRTLFLSGVPLAHKYIPHHWKACSELTLPVNACSRSEIAKRLSALILTWGLGIDVPLPERERLGIKFHCWGGALGRHITGGTNVEPAGSPKVTCYSCRQSETRCKLEKQHIFSLGSLQPNGTAIEFSNFSNL